MAERIQLSPQEEAYSCIHSWKPTYLFSLLRLSLVGCVVTLLSRKSFKNDVSLTNGQSVSCFGLTGN